MTMTNKRAASAATMPSPRTKLFLIFTLLIPEAAAFSSPAKLFTCKTPSASCTPIINMMAEAPESFAEYMAKRQAGGSATTTATAPSSPAPPYMPMSPPPRAHAVPAPQPPPAPMVMPPPSDGNANYMPPLSARPHAAPATAQQQSQRMPTSPDRRQMSDLSAQERAATIRAQRLDESQYDRTRAYSGIPGARSAEERNRERRKAQEEEDPYGRPAPPDFGVTGRYRVVTPGSLGPTRYDSLLEPNDGKRFREDEPDDERLYVGGERGVDRDYESRRYDAAADIDRDYESRLQFFERENEVRYDERPPPPRYEDDDQRRYEPIVGDGGEEAERRGFEAQAGAAARGGTRQSILAQQQAFQSERPRANYNSATASTDNSGFPNFSPKPPAAYEEDPVERERRESRRRERGRAAKEPPSFYQTPSSEFNRPYGGDDDREFVDDRFNARDMPPPSPMRHREMETDRPATLYSVSEESPMPGKEKEYEEYQRMQLQQQQEAERRPPPPEYFNGSGGSGGMPPPQAYTRQAPPPPIDEERRNRSPGLRTTFMTPLL